MFERFDRWCRESFNYYVGDASTKIGAGIFAGSIVAIVINKSINGLPITLLILSLFFFIIGYIFINDYEKYRKR